MFGDRPSAVSTSPVSGPAAGAGRACALTTASSAIALLMGVPFASAQVLTPAPVVAEPGVTGPAGQNAAQRDMALSIDNVCPTLNARVSSGVADAREAILADSCTAMVGAGNAITDGEGPLSAEEYNGVVQAINGEEILSVDSDLREIGGVQIGNIRGRMAAIRSGLGGGLSVAGLSIDAGERVLALGDRQDYTIVPAQFEDDFLGRLGIFVTGGVKLGEKDSTGAAEGFDFDSEGLTVGADYRVSDQVAFGAAVGYSRFNSEFDSTIDSPGGQELNSDSVLFSLFGTWFPTDRLYVDGIATVGWSFYDSERRVVIPDVIVDVDDTAEGEFDAFQYSFAGDVGYEIPVAGATITPLVRAEYIKAEIDGFSEDPIEGALELEYGDQDIDSFTTSIGLEASYPISTGFGIIQPGVRAEYIHEFLDDQDGVIIGYAADDTGAGFSRFEATTEEVDQDYGLVGASVTATFAGGWAAFADYSTLVALADFDVHAFNIGLRKEF